MRALDPAPADGDHCAGDDVGFEVLPKRALGVGFGHHRNPVAGHLDQQVVEVVLVNLAVLAGGQADLPHPDALVFEEDLGSDAPQCPIRHHFIAFPAPAPWRAKRTVCSTVEAEGRVRWIKWECRIPSVRL